MLLIDRKHHYRAFSTSNSAESSVMNTLPILYTVYLGQARVNSFIAVSRSGNRCVHFMRAYLIIIFGNEVV